MGPWPIHRSKILLIAMTAITCVGIMLWNFYEEEMPYKTVRVTREDIMSVIPATGIVESRINVELSSPVAGQVTDVLVSEGDWVKKYQVLVTLDEQEANAFKQKAKAVLEWRRLQYTLAAKTYRRLNNMAAAGGASAQTVDSAKADMEIAQTLLNVADAELRLTEVSFERLKIRSPVTGIVAKQTVKVGEWTGRITSQDIFNPKALFTIVDPNLGVLIRCGTFLFLSLPGAHYPESFHLSGLR